MSLLPTPPRSGGPADEPLVDSLEATVARYGLFNEPGPMVVGASGGPDSTALLHALAARSPRWSIQPIAAHLNHGFRGAESDSDEQYVVALCGALGIECLVERIDVPALCAERGYSAQEGARLARHDFLRRVKTRTAARSIALAHTRSDRIETILMNMIRGSGIDGLAAMQAAAPPLIRPLINTSRHAVETYCAKHGLSPQTDSSNQNLHYTRNRVRAELLPYLTAYYNQSLGDALIRMADIAAAEGALLDQIASDALNAAGAPPAGERVDMAAGWLLALDPALQRRVLREAVRRVEGTTAGLAYCHTEIVLSGMVAGTAVTVELPGGNGARIRTVRGRVIVERVSTSANARLEWRSLLAVPGEILLEVAGGRLKASVMETLPVNTSCGLFLPMSAVTPPLEVRSWMSGDRMRPAGLGGSKKVQDIFTDRKISAEERATYPIIVDDSGRGRLIAVLGLCADEASIRTGSQPGVGPYLLLQRVCNEGQMALSSHASRGAP